MLRRSTTIVIAVLVTAAILTAGALAGGLGRTRGLLSAFGQPRHACRYLVVDAYDLIADAFRGEITIDHQAFSFDSTDIARPRTFTFKNHPLGAHRISAIFSFDTAWPRRSAEYAGELTLGESDFYRLAWPTVITTDSPRVAALTVAPVSQDVIRRVMGDSFKTIASCENAKTGISYTR